MKAKLRKSLRSAVSFLHRWTGMILGLSLIHIYPGNGGSSLSSRGFTDSNSVAQLFDGVRQFGGVGQTFLYDPWAVDRIEVLRGPASVLYGCLLYTSRCV